MRDVTFPPVTTHHNTSIQRKRLAAIQGSSRSPDEEGLHVLVLQDLHGCLLGSVSLRDREKRLLRLRHHRAREVVLVDRVVLGRHGPVQEWHDVAKDVRRVGVP